MDLKYVDIFYLNWPFSDMTKDGKEWLHRPLKEFWEDMESCVKRGYAKNLGIANFNGQLLNEILSIANIKPVALQIECHPYLNQDGLIGLAKKRGIQVLAHTALGRGLELEDEQCVIKEDIINDIANKHGKTPAQISSNQVSIKESESLQGHLRLRD